MGTAYLTLYISFVGFKHEIVTFLHGCAIEVRVETLAAFNRHISVHLKPQAIFNA